MIIGWADVHRILGDCGMPEVVKFAVARQADARGAAKAIHSAAKLEPLPKTGTATAKLTANPAEQFGAAGRILSPRWLNALAPFLLVPETRNRTDGDSDKAEKAFTKLYISLNSAHAARNASQLEVIATRHLAEVAAAPKLASITPDIYRFFKARGCAATAAELATFASQYSKQQLQAFLAGSAEEVSALKAQAIAAMVNGTLSSLKIDILFQIRAIIAFQAVAKAVLDAGYQPPAIPVKVICQLLDVEIDFPEWCFDVDPCRWPQAVTGPRNAATAPGVRAAAVSPLRQRLDREAAAATARNQGDTAASGSGEVTVLQPLVVDPDPCSCEEDLVPVCLPPDPCCAKIDYFVTDTLVLRDRTVRYVASDLAYIENIAASEARVREHTFAKTIEDYSEDEVTSTKSEERDHTVSEKASVQKEIENNLKMAADVEAKYNGGSYSVTANASISKETAQTEAREQMREAVDKAVTKLQVETRKLTTRRSTTREEEKNSHSFTNESDNHIVAKYFYVSKEAEGQIFSHGLRMTVQVLLPSPAALYNRLEQIKIERSFGKEKPVFPELPKSWDLVDVAKYEDYRDGFGLKSTEAPLIEPDPKWVYPTFQGNQDGSHTIAIESGYYISKIKITTDPDLSFSKSNTGGQIVLSAGGGSVWFAHWKKGDDTFTREFERDVSIYGTTTDVAVTIGEVIDGYTVAFGYLLSPIPIDQTAWKKTAFAEMTKIVADATKAYDEEFARYVAEMKKANKGRHPFREKEILLAELKRAAIYMMCEDFERHGVMNMNSQPCGYPVLNRKAAAEQTWHWYFWERAFDWRLMSFAFYDYFWNRMCDWPEKFDPGHDNFMFNAFDKAGLARVTIPVSPGMDADVIWYLETGQKWGLTGSPPRNPADPRWIAITQEIKHARDCYQNDREGVIVAVLDPVASLPTSQVLLRESDRYWDGIAGGLDFDAIETDVNREIYIGGIAYRIQDIVQNPGSPAYDPAAPGPTMEWIVTLDRTFEGVGNGNTNPNGPVTLTQYLHAIGAEFVGAPFRWQEPTNLVWLGDQSKAGKPNFCLPEYPVKC